MSSTPRHRQQEAAYRGRRRGSASSHSSMDHQSSPSRSPYQLGLPYEDEDVPRHQRARGEAARKYGHKAAGDADPTGNPSQLLLFRKLKPALTEEVFATGVMKLYKTDEEEAAASARQSSTGLKSTSAPTNFGAKKNSLKRVFLVRDKASGENCGYGLAEFFTVEEDAKGALTKYSATKSFTISSKEVDVCYAHLGVFIQAPAENTPDFTFPATSDSTLRLQYRDGYLYASEHVVTAVPPDVPESSALQQNEDLQSKAYAEQGENAKSKKRKAEDGAALTTKKKTIMMAADFSKWNKAEAEQRSEPAEAARHSIEGADEARTTTTAAGSSALPTDGLIDFATYQCYLCKRNLKSLENLNLHLDKSDLHKKNLTNQTAIVQGWEKLRKDRPEITISMLSTVPSTIQYRDRAKERKAAEVAMATVSKKSTSPAPASSSSAPPKQSVAEKLMAKAGFTAGTGLGANGAGITTAIEPQMYRPGVGLGAEGGKLGTAVDVAEKSYLEKGKDAARERWEAMNRRS